MLSRTRPKRRTTARSPGLTKVTLQADWYPQPEHGGFFTAVVKGYYKEEGLDVTIVPLGPYLDADKQVASGRAQFALQASDHVLEAIANGQPLVAIAAFFVRLEITISTVTCASSVFQQS